MKRRRRRRLPEAEDCIALQFDLFDAPTKIAAPQRAPPATNSNCARAGEHGDGRQEG